MIGIVVVAFLSLWGAYLTIVSCYLGIVSLLAAWPCRRNSGQPGQLRGPSFLILVPAYNEAPRIAELARSLAALDYEANQVTRVLIADNCTDETASVARRHDFIVEERCEPERKAKGWALRWFIERHLPRFAETDFIVILDADSQLAPDFLKQAALAINRGALALQGRVIPDRSPGDRWGRLHLLALTGANTVKPLGRSRLGGTAGLVGPGAVLRCDLFDRVSWTGDSLVEDLDLALQLVMCGVRVRFLPHAEVRTQAPASHHTAQSQRLRWEGGRLRAARHFLPRLAAAFFRSPRVAVGEQFLELATPPLSAFLFQCLLFSAAWAPFIGYGALLCLTLLAPVFLYVMVAVVRSGCGWTTLLGTPWYVLWKGALFLKMVWRGTPDQWVRTERNEESRQPAPPPKSVIK